MTYLQKDGDRDVTDGMGILVSSNLSRPAAHCVSGNTFSLNPFCIFHCDCDMTQNSGKVLVCLPSVACSISFLSSIIEGANKMDSVPNIYKRKKRGGNWIVRWIACRDKKKKSYYLVNCFEKCLTHQKHKLPCGCYIYTHQSRRIKEFAWLSFTPHVYSFSPFQQQDSSKQINYIAVA